MPRAPRASNRDSPFIGIYDHISPLERLRKVICKVKREKRRGALREGESFKTCASRRGCFHLDAIVEGEREITGRCIFVGHEMRVLRRSTVGLFTVGVVLP